MSDTEFVDVEGDDNAVDFRSMKKGRKVSLIGAWAISRISNSYTIGCLPVR